ncbi:MAG TPA: SDR family oxidoreductase [Egibacteraceae bacterium]|nr:SDR family oxidoreductase [Egibacteraceae bacterium]
MTGASTGIGQAAARELARLGFRVFGGVRSEADAEAARRIGLSPVRLDVTDEPQVQRVRQRLEDESDGRVDVLVNNAGIGVAGPLESVEVEALRRQLDVNLLGVHRMVRALAPMLIAAGGRIVNISSISGRIGYPYLGAYAASKHALEGYSDALRRELSPHGVRVVVVQPGVIDTPIWGKSALSAEQVAALPERYRREAGRVLSGLDRTGLRAPSPERVARVIGRAATAARPRARYALPLGTRIQARLVPLVPEALIDWAADRALGRR